VNNREFTAVTSDGTFSVPQPKETLPCPGNSAPLCIALSQESDRIHFVIEDRGRGLDPQKIAQNRLGVEGIRKRAKVFGGQAVIDSAPGKGTRIAVDLPFVETWN